MTKKITAIIISFLRPGYTIACIESLRRMYPDIKIIVGENGERDEEVAEVCKKNEAEYIQLPFDSGVCVGRNTLMKYVKTEYVLVGDDDLFYDKYAMVDSMVDFLEGHNEFDLIGGRVIVKGQVENYQGYIEKKEDGFLSNPLEVDKVKYKKDGKSGLRYCPVDLTFNYFVARVDKVKQVPWDDKIKVVYEHFSWFYDFKCFGGKVAFSPDPIVVHKPSHVNHKQKAEYAGYRMRQDDRNRFFEKYKIDYIISMNGVKTLKENPIKMIKKSKKYNDTKHVDFCITAFKRRKALEKLLVSIIKYYPMANIYIADQNETFDREYYKMLKNRMSELGLLKRLDVRYIGFDKGVSFARNYLVANTPNKYKLILDDDFEFTEETDIGKFVKLMEVNPNIYIVGGLVKQLGHDLNFEFNIEVKDGVIKQIPDGHNYKEYGGITYKRTGCVLNFALMKKDLFNYITWDNDLKVAEHLDFYTRLKRFVNVQILYTSEVTVSHPPAEREGDYKEYRQRWDYQAVMMRKHKVNKIQYLNGQVVELLPDGSLKRYKLSTLL